MGKEKPKAEGYWRAPWIMKKGEFETFIPVTEANRKQAIVIGRILYTISKESGNNYRYCGFITVQPCFFIGWWQMPIEPFIPRDAKFKSKTHWKVYLDKNKNRDEWGSEYKTLFDRLIKDKELYIKQSDPILTFIKEP